MVNKLFFELIRVAIGNQFCLSYSPTAEVWRQLYDIAKKQSLVGVCFSGVQRLQEQNQGPPEMLYLTWMGMAAKILQRNEVVNRQCVELQARLAVDGIKSVVLKGQGIEALYCSNLQMLRQSGDIDIYVPGGMKKVLSYCTKKFGKVSWDYINAHAPFYQDTEVELHWRVQALTNLYRNRSLQEWLNEQEQNILQGREADLGCGKIIVPAIEFNAFYILLHCYHHMFESGLGLRQLMDYYFVLLEYSKAPCTDSITGVFKQFGLSRFASAVMWIMKYVFGMEEKFLLCEPDEKEGRFILREVMQNGNFGHHDTRKIKVKSKLAQPFVTRIQHNWHLATHYPSEFFWAPVWLVYHYIWKRTRNKRIYNIYRYEHFVHSSVL